MSVIVNLWKDSTRREENQEVQASNVESKNNKRTLQFFKVAFSTFWFEFGATLRRQVERRDSGTGQKASNLAQPVS